MASTGISPAHLSAPGIDEFGSLRLVYHDGYQYQHLIEYSHDAIVYHAEINRVKRAPAMGDRHIGMETPSGYGNRGAGGPGDKPAVTVSHRNFSDADAAAVL